MLIYKMFETSRNNFPCLSKADIDSTFNSYSTLFHTCFIYFVGIFAVVFSIFVSIDSVNVILLLLFILCFD
jgi:hypothetical protein